jgi:hypothetical protein
MPHPKLDSLVQAGVLTAEPPERAELEGLIHSGSVRLTDAQNPSLSIESRFDLAYNAGHALSLAALRWHGYRPNNKRYIVFQTLAHTLSLAAAEWKVLSEAHNKRNRAEYEGAVDVDQATVDALLRVVGEIATRIKGLPLPS